MAIEVSSMDNPSAPTHTELAATPQSCTRHVVFQSFLYDNIKQDADTTISHSKLIIELSKQHKIQSDKLSKQCEIHIVFLCTTYVPLHYT